MPARRDRPLTQRTQAAQLATQVRGRARSRDTQSRPGASTDAFSQMFAVERNTREQHRVTRYVTYFLQCSWRSVGSDDYLHDSIFTNRLF